MQTATQDSVAAIKEIGGTINRISEIASTIAAAVEEQGAATQEIARNVGEAAKGTQQVASNITDVNRGAGETGSASAQGAVIGTVAVARKQSPQVRGRQVPYDGTGCVREQLPASTVKQAKRMPPHRYPRGLSFWRSDGKSASQSCSALSMGSSARMPSRAASLPLSSA
jgi:hypothetical protein